MSQGIMAKKLDQALAEADKATRADAENYMGEAIRSVVRCTRGKSGDALSAADMALNMQETSAFARIARALSLKVGRRYDESYQEVDKALALVGGASR